MLAWLVVQQIMLTWQLTIMFPFLNIAVFTLDAKAIVRAIMYQHPVVTTAPCPVSDAAT